jgi:hypothetical protein
MAAFCTYEIVEEEVNLSLALADEADLRLLQVSIHFRIALPDGILACEEK